MSPEKKKKPGLTVIGIGKPKEGGLSAPGPLGPKLPAEKSAPRKPYGGIPKPAPDTNLDGTDENGIGAPLDETGETPSQEGDEEYGAKLIADMKAPLAAAGVAPEHVKPVLAALFQAMADCLNREGGDEEGGAEGADMGAPAPGGPMHAASGY